MGITLPRRRRWYAVPPDLDRLIANWERFEDLASARLAHWWTACIYSFVDPAYNLVDYVGQTGKGLGPRYRMDPAKAQGQVIFVAPMAANLLGFVEHRLIYRNSPVDNRRGHGTLPLPIVPIIHRFQGVELGEPNYEGPLF